MSQRDFIARPHRTLVRLTLPVLLSLIAEPITGLVDTAFVSRLGEVPLAALGVGTVVLSGLFWIFNFLGIGTQTEVARSLGARQPERAAEVHGLAALLALGCGTGLLVAGLTLAPSMAGWMGATGEVAEGAATYLGIRFLAAPALLFTSVAFGGLRGVLDMRTPMLVAVLVNLFNIALDPVLIFGAGPIPAMGIAGAAWATVASQWIGAALCLVAVLRRIGRPATLHLSDARLLLVVGRDLFIRTGLLTLFILLTTRVATRAGSEAGAAHQAIRQVWMLMALVLDAFAHTAQSLVGTFRGAGERLQMRRVAGVTCLWSLATGGALAAMMLLGTTGVVHLLVPPAAERVFHPAWLAAALAQPLNALAFATDGVHWGTADYRFLRNGMLVSTFLGGLGLLAIDVQGPSALTSIWLVTAAWMAVRSVFGLGRIWPGIGASPFRPQPSPPAPPAAASVSPE